MTVAEAVGMVRTADHRYSFNGGPWYPSVTGILGTLDKPALVAWAKAETAACAIRNLDVLTAMQRESGAESAVAWLKGIPDYQRDSAANRGTRVHAAADAYSRGEPMADIKPEEIPFIDAYLRAYEELDIRVVASELMVMHEGVGYGGTLDMIAVVDGAQWLLDIKTSKGVYRETALQLVAYANAEYAGFADSPLKFDIPDVDRFGVLHIRPDVYPDKGYRLVEYDVTGAWRAFCALARVYAWSKGPDPRKGTQ